MKAYILLLTLISLTACGKSLDYNVQIEPTLAPEVEAFQQSALANGRIIEMNNITIVFDTTGVTSELKPGRCTLKPHTEVLINKAFYIKVSPWIQRELIFHELGHCLLGKEHNDSGLQIMNTFLMNQNQYNEATHTQYDTALFN